MSKLNKILKKILPRIGAVAVACVCGFALFAFNYFVLFEPDHNKIDIKFEIADKDDDSDKDTEQLTYSDKSFNFLVMGHDRAARLTDVIMLINYDVENQKITILQLPRDTYIEIDDYTYHKINGMYNYCISAAEADGSKDPELDGCIRMAEYLEKNMALTIHYCAVMDLDGFSGIVDTVGGVDMYVPMDMYYSDPGQNLYINLKEGYQHLDGDKAEQFVRFRYGYPTGDIGRGDAQKLFISAFISKLQSSLASADAGMVTRLANNVIKYVKTNITAADIVYMGKNLIGLGRPDRVKTENISLMTMPGMSTMYDGASYYVMNKAWASEIINNNFNIFNIDITSSFDKDELFTANNASLLRDYYYADKESCTLTVYNAGSLGENGLDG